MADTRPTFHVPVLLDAVLAAAEGARRAVDATLGDGGHAAALLERGMHVLGIDRDPEALAISRARLGTDRMQYLLAPYASPVALAAVHQFSPEFILLDLGVSSRQLDQEARGFTFRPGAPLDMRMGAGGQSAADMLNTAPEEDLEPSSESTETSGGLIGWRARSSAARAGSPSQPAMISSMPSGPPWARRRALRSSPGCFRQCGWQ